MKALSRITILATMLCCCTLWRAAASADTAAPIVLENADFRLEISAGEYR